MEKIVSELMKNKTLIGGIKESIKDIMEDGKIDASDTPAFIRIIVVIMNELHLIKLDEKDTKEVLSLFVRELNKQLNVMCDIEEEKFLKLLDLSIELMLFNPNTVSGCFCF